MILFNTAMQFHIMEVWIVITTLIFQVAFSDNSTTNNRLVQLYDCVCPGEDLVYECTVCSEGATVWTGSIFFCPGNEIVLRHSEFENSSISGECNSGGIGAQSIKVTYTPINKQQCFFSQLNISTGVVRENETVKCLYVVGTNESLIDLYNIKFTTEKLPPPGDIYLSDINSTFLTFSWTSLPFNCPSITYIITSNGNCGRCPKSSTETSATCIDMIPNGQICTLYLQTKICGNIIGEKSTPLNIKLEVVDSPSVVIYSVFEVNSNNVDAYIANLLVSFNKSSQFNITERVDGSAEFYVINYTAYPSGIGCGSAKISSLSCEDGVCHHNFTPASSSFCSASVVEGIAVTAYAVNILGNGPISNAITILAPKISGSTHSSDEKIQNQSECLIPVSIVSVLILFLALSVALVVVVVVLLKRMKQRSTQQFPNVLEDVPAVYEEIQLSKSSMPATTVAVIEDPPIAVKTKENIAYCQITKTAVTTTENVAYNQIKNTQNILQINTYSSIDAVSRSSEKCADFPIFSDPK